MLACARLGAVHSVVFGGFAAAELATRIDDAQPKAILSASCGIEPARVVAYKPLVDAANGLARHKPEFCLILQRPHAEAAMTAGSDHDWAEAVAGGKPHDCVTAATTATPSILYHSDTPLQPKGLVRPTGSPRVHPEVWMN